MFSHFFTYQERRIIVGKCKKIEGWKFTIHNESRSKRQGIEAQEATLKRQVTFRLDSNLLDALKSAAKRDHRSLNNFVETRLMEIMYK